VLIALPAATFATVAVRFGLRKRLHHARERGECLRRVVVVGHERAVIRLARQLRRHRRRRPDHDPAGGRPAHAAVEHPRLEGGARFVKEVVDRLGAALLLLALSPVLLAVAVCIRLDSPGPVLFRQVRTGRDGREFLIYKFRSMYLDAEARLAEIRHLNENDGVLFKVRNDPRITPVGRRLRRLSLDELPQLFNVLRGQMSLVGPRPPLPQEVAQYADDVRRRLAVKPGMTGLWQVSGRSDLPWEEAVRLDLRYVESWSLSLDLVILMRTVAAVLRPSGAN
jgi:exopolysaccharide biosynthesis polyprenyl glycosylphosphotransferase